MCVEGAVGVGDGVAPASAACGRRVVDQESWLIGGWDGSGVVIGDGGGGGREGGGLMLY